jgi:hypothetical protein
VRQQKKATNKGEIKKRKKVKAEEPEDDQE